MDKDNLSEEKFLELAEKAESGNKPCIIIFQDTDGNWRGALKNKYPNPVHVRAIGPETVLQELLTHDGI